MKKYSNTAKNMAYCWFGKYFTAVGSSKTLHFDYLILQGILLIKICFAVINWACICFCICGMVWEFPLLGLIAE